jgi:hypothetical protein
MTIAKEINSFESRNTNELYNRIADDLVEVKYKDKFTTFETFSRSIKINFGLSNDSKPRDIRKIKRFLVDGMNEILGYLKDKFGDLDLAKENYICLENNTFIVYTSLLAPLWDREEKSPVSNWEDKLEEKLEGIDFNRNYPLWDELQLFNSSITNKSISKIAEHFTGRELS